MPGGIVTSLEVLDENQGMGYRGSKSDSLISVKEQRVDGSSVWLFKLYCKVYSKCQGNLVFIQHIKYVSTIFESIRRFYTKISYPSGGPTPPGGGLTAGSSRLKAAAGPILSLILAPSLVPGPPRSGKTWARPRQGLQSYPRGLGNNYDNSLFSKSKPVFFFRSWKKDLLCCLINTLDLSISFRKHGRLLSIKTLPLW